MMSLSRSAKAALRQAEAEGLTVQRSESSSSGYKGVTFNSSRSKIKPYLAQVNRGGKKVHLGSFATAEEAALCYARSPEAQAAAAAPPEPPPLTAEEAVRQAGAEGLTLLQSETSSTGFKGVSFNGNRSKPYQAYVSRGGKSTQVNLGYFATAEEAALCYARMPEAQAAAAAPPAPPPLTVEEALRQAEAEGLTLLRSNSSSTGFKGVRFDSNCKSKPYRALVQRGGKLVSLGSFATPEHAALSYARTPEAQAASPASPAPPLLTTEEALRQAEAEGLTLLRSGKSSTGFKGVSFDSTSNKSKPYYTHVKRGGKQVYLGCFTTAEEAAMCVARASAAQAAAPQPTATSSRKRKVKSEEQPPDMPAGARVKLEELPPMPPDARIKREY